MQALFALSPSMPTTFIYLHGFLSSPKSIKAQLLAVYLRENHPDIDYAVPALPESPQAAYVSAEAAVQSALAKKSQVGLIGSSMGGFYATVLAERFGLRAVIINPSVQPQLSVRNYFGTHRNPYSGAEFSIGLDDALAFEKMAVARLKHPENYWLLAQTGDEVLDYRTAVEFYQGARQTIEAGGDHQFQHFDRHLPALIKFLQFVPE